MSARWRAFDKPLDPTWRPQPGERVYIDSWQHISAIVIWATDRPPAAKVEIGYGRRPRKLLVPMERIRPFPTLKGESNV